MFGITGIINILTNFGIGAQTLQQLRSPLTLDQLHTLQGQDDKCTTLTWMLENGKLDPVAYSLQEGILYR